MTVVSPSTQQSKDKQTTTTNNKRHSHSSNHRHSRRRQWHSSPTTLLLFLLILLITNTESKPTTNLYKTLNLTNGKKSTPSEIQKAYRKLALRYHPDKIPSDASPSVKEHATQKFKEVGGAYEVLKDGEMKKRYDRYGERGLEQGFQDSPFGGGGGGMGGMGGGGMSSFFGNGQGMGQGMGGGGGGGGGMDGLNFGNAAQFFFGGGGVPNYMEQRQTSTGGGGGRKQKRRPAAGGGGQGPSEMDVNELLSQFLGTGGQRQPPPPPRPPPRPTGQQTQRNTKRPFERSFTATLEELANPDGCTKRLRVSMPATPPRYGDTNPSSTSFKNTHPTVDKIYTIQLKPGWKPGTKVSFPPSKDGTFPPITFVLRQKAHKHFVRVKDDLIYRHRIERRRMSKPAGKRGMVRLPMLPSGEEGLEVDLDNGVIAKEEDGDGGGGTSSSLGWDAMNGGPMPEGYALVLKGKGMPIRGGPERGDLIMEFEIVEDCVG